MVQKIQATITQFDLSWNTKKHKNRVKMLITDSAGKTHHRNGVLSLKNQRIQYNWNNVSETISFLPNKRLGPAGHEIITVR